MNIRQASTRDYPDILRIYNQAVLAGGPTGDESPLSLEERRPWLDLHTGKHYSLYVAEGAGSILGYLALSPTGTDALHSITPQKSPITLKLVRSVRAWPHA